MKKSILLFSLALCAMEQDSSTENSIYNSIVDKFTKKNLDLNPLQNISRRKKIKLVDSFILVIGFYLDQMDERVQSIQAMKLTKKKIVARLRRSQERIFKEKQELTKLITILQIHKYQDLELTIKNPEQHFANIINCLSIILKRKITASPQGLNLENTTLELIAFLYSKLLEMKQQLDKLENSEEIYKKYKEQHEELKEKIVHLFLQKAEKNSRWILINQLKRFDEVKKDPQDQEDKLSKTNEEEKKNEPYKYKKEQSSQYLHYFKKIDSFIRRKEKRRHLLDAKNQTEYWLYKALSVNYSIKDNIKTYEIYQRLDYSPRKYVDNYVQKYNMILSLSKKENQINKIYKSLDLKSPKSLEDLFSNPSFRERLESSKKQSKKNALKLLEEAEKLTESDPVQAQMLVNKAKELGADTFLIYYIEGRINNLYMYSMDAQELLERARRLDDSLRPKKKHKQKPKEESEEAITEEESEHESDPTGNRKDKEKINH